MSTSTTIKIPEIKDLRDKKYSSLRAGVPLPTGLGNIETQIKINEDKDGKHYVNFPGHAKRKDGTIGDDCSGSDKGKVILAIQAAYEARVGEKVKWGYVPRV